MTLEELADICYKVRDEDFKLVSASIVVQNEDGKVRVYNTNGYGGYDEYYDYQV